MSIWNPPIRTGVPPVARLPKVFLETGAMEDFVLYDKGLVVESETISPLMDGVLTVHLDAGHILNHNIRLKTPYQTSEALCPMIDLGEGHNQLKMVVSKQAPIVQAKAAEVHPEEESVPKVRIEPGDRGGVLETYPVHLEVPLSIEATPDGGAIVREQVNGRRVLSYQAVAGTLHTYPLEISVAEMYELDALYADVTPEPAVPSEGWL